MGVNGNQIAYSRNACSLKDKVTETRIYYEPTHIKDNVLLSNHFLYPLILFRSVYLLLSLPSIPCKLPIVLMTLRLVGQ